MTVHDLSAIDRPLPQSPDAERAILGSILINPGVIHRIAGITVDSFFREAHRIIFGAMARMAEEGIEIDLLTLKRVLGDDLESVGGSAYIASLVDRIPDIAHVETYARAVLLDAGSRAVIMECEAAKARAMERGSDPAAIAADLSARLLSVKRSSNDSRDLVEVLSESFTTLRRRADGEVAGNLTSGWYELDEARAFRRGSFTLILSPSNHGKTAFAVNAAEAFAKHGHHVQIGTLESTEGEVSLRWGSSVSGVAHSRTQDWTKLVGRPADFNRLHEARKLAGERAIKINRKTRFIEDMRSEWKRLVAVWELEVAVIDFIQMIRTRERVGSSEERYAHIAQSLLEIAIELNICIIATSQVSKDWRDRAVHGASKGEVVGYDIDQEDAARCKAISESARSVITLYRPALVGCTKNRYGQEITECFVDLNLVKNNENRRNRYPAHFRESTQLFAMGDCDCSAKNDEPVQKALMGVAR